MLCYIRGTVKTRNGPYILTVDINNIPGSSVVVTMMRYILFDKFTWDDFYLSCAKRKLDMVPYSIHTNRLITLL